MVSPFLSCLCFERRVRRRRVLLGGQASALRLWRLFSGQSLLSVLECPAPALSSARNSRTLCTRRSNESKKYRYDSHPGGKIQLKPSAWEKLLCAELLQKKGLRLGARGRAQPGGPGWCASRKRAEPEASRLLDADGAGLLEALSSRLASTRGKRVNLPHKRSFTV